MDQKLIEISKWYYGTRFGLLKDALPPNVALKGEQAVTSPALQALF